MLVMPGRGAKKGEMCLVRVTLFLLCHFDEKGLKSKC